MDSFNDNPTRQAAVMRALSLVAALLRLAVGGALAAAAAAKLLYRSGLGESLAPIRRWLFRPVSSWKLPSARTGAVAVGLPPKLLASWRQHATDAHAWAA